jgi:hypothetical protein
VYGFYGISVFAEITEVPPGPTWPPSHWRRVRPSESPSSIRLREVPDPPVCERHWEDFLYRHAIPIGWCVDCEAYGTLAAVSPCGRRFESF